VRVFVCVCVCFNLLCAALCVLCVNRVCAEIFFSAIEFRVLKFSEKGEEKEKKNERARAQEKKKNDTHTHTRNIDARGGDRVRAFDVRLFFSISSLRSSSSRGEKSFCFLSRFLKKSHLSLFLVLCDSRFRVFAAR